jgi:hypothetical protein
MYFSWAWIICSDTLEIWLHILILYYCLTLSGMIELLLIVIFQKNYVIWFILRSMSRNPETNNSHDTWTICWSELSLHTASFTCVCHNSWLHWAPAYWPYFVVSLYLLTVDNTLGSQTWLQLHIHFFQKDKFFPFYQLCEQLLFYNFYRQSTFPYFQRKFIKSFRNSPREIITAFQFLYSCVK